MQNVNTGYLELILGPMFSGKTSKLLEIHKQYTFCKIPVIVINYHEDNRYDNTLMSTHDQRKIECVKASTIADVMVEQMDKFRSSEPLAVLINEGQFFEDIVPSVCDIVTRYRKHVYIAGLDGDFKREVFGDLLELIPMCDSVTTLKSLCVSCRNGTLAPFSHRIDHTQRQQKCIGTDDLYVPLCRSCYDRCAVATL